MELVFPLAGLQGDHRPVDEAPGLGDAVGVPAHQGPQVAAVVLIFRQGVVAQHHVQRFSVPVRDTQGPDRGPEGQYLGFQRPPCQGPDLHGLSIPGHAEGRSRHRHVIASLFLSCGVFYRGAPPRPSPPSIPPGGWKNKVEMGDILWYHQGTKWGRGPHNPVFASPVPAIGTDGLRFAHRRAGGKETCLFSRPYGAFSPTP